MSSKEIMAVLIPTGILALVWVIFESAVLKVVKKKGKSSDNKRKTEINLKKENSTDSVDDQDTSEDQRTTITKIMITTL